MHIAMWSGPRNLSTAMMYSFGARAEFSVLDEPFYAAYLDATGLDHPMRAEILDTMETDPAVVAQQFQTKHSLYTKQMTHHILDGFPRDWFANARHAFLIRHPARVVASYAVKREAPTLDDIGFVQQCEIFEEVRAMGTDPVVVDSFDIRQDPEATLRKLCTALGLDWDPAMLHWPAGGHQSDGVWAAHWYGAVHKSTGFADPEGPLPEIADDLKPLVDAAMPSYDRLAAFKI
ncbi:sulfotransferase [Aliishimia ponticola]|nr:sulfotransferase [Aliishimia ponticola]